MVEAIATWATDVVRSLGYVGVEVLVALESVFPPLPSELILPLASFLVAQGELSLVWVVVAATVGSVVGALVLYALGRWVGDERLRAFVRGPGRWLLLRESDLDQAEEWFDRHGNIAVLIGRLVPFVRSGVSVPAGVERMTLPTFVLYTAVGSLLWNGLLVVAGYWFGSQWHWVQEYARYLEWAALAAVAAGVGWFLWKRLGSSGEPRTG